jgi:hypothetical protein
VSILWETPAAIPLDLANDVLSADEQETADRLLHRLNADLPFLQVHAEYYSGEQRMRHLGISVPPELEHKLRAAVGWPRVIVDAIRYKLRVSGFRYPAELEADTQAWDIWQANKMAAKSQLAHLACLKYGRCFLVAGSDGPDGMPLLTAESPTTMAAEFDAGTHQVTSALQLYRFYGGAAAALYLPGQTIHLVRPASTMPGVTQGWELRERDRHGMEQPPVTMLVNRSELEDLYGRSEITPEVMSITDAACRRLLGMDVASEFFGTLQRYIIGAAMSNFQTPDGDPIAAWESYIGRLLVLERDEEGNVPAVGTFQANSPQPLIDVLQLYARLMSSVSRVSPHRLGLSTDNPVSAEAIKAEDAQLDELAVSKHDAYSDAWMQHMQHALTIAGGGTLPGGARQLEVLWASPSVPSPVTLSQAMLAQVQSGAVPPTSDVVLEQLGYTPVQIARIKADREQAASEINLAAIADALSSGTLAKELGADAGLAAPQQAEKTAAANAAGAGGQQQPAGR